MLTIKHIDEFRSKVSHKEEIRESDLGNGLKCFCYMVSDNDTFNDAFSREARGIVFDSRGAVVGRPLHKFFNVNERPETQVGAIDWSKVVRVMDKRDGSMIHTVMTEDDIRLKSKKSFESPVAYSALLWLNEAEQCRTVRWMIREIVGQNCTAIFEWTAPDARIVLHYPTPELRLLHVRDNYTGHYWPAEDVREIAERYGAGLVDEPTFSGVSKENLGEYLLNLAKTIEGIEGWVVQFENGDMVKLKTDWYLKRHRSMTFLRERDIAEMVVDQNIDDLKSLLVGEGVDISQIVELENQVLSEIRNVERSVNTLVPPEDYKLERKEFVLKYRESAGPLFGLLMNKYSGKHIDYVEYFRKNMLKQMYSLNQLNLMPSVAEVE